MKYAKAWFTIKYVHIINRRRMRPHSIQPCILYVVSSVILFVYVFYLFTRNSEPSIQLTYPRDGNTDWRNLSYVQMLSLSTLGRILFLGEDIPPIIPDKKFTILIWKVGPALERRHITWYNHNKHQRGPFDTCSASNCELTYDSEQISNADAVVFLLHRLAKKDRDKVIELSAMRRPGQRWIFITDESPPHTFLSGGHMEDWNGLFNWSMTYRMDSDIPVPYGRTVPNLDQSNTSISMTYDLGLPPTKTKLVAILISNCGKNDGRWKYLSELRKYIDVDVLGPCGDSKYSKTICPGHFAADCPILSTYKFYLAFENTRCKEYITEKTWWNAYSKGVVPVIRGTSQSVCAQLLPPDSYINVDSFRGPKELAEYLKHLDTNDLEYQRYFQWKKKYTVLQEHGYFGSPSIHYCRICEALNYNSQEEKMYNVLEEFWNSETDCTI